MPDSTKVEILDPDSLQVVVSRDAVGIPAGGTTGQTLAKSSGTDYDAAWSSAGSGDLLAANNLSDVALASTARTNLGLAIGTDVQAYAAALDAVTGTNTGDEAAASATVSGTVELATIAEVDTGTDTVRAVTPAGLAGSALQTKVDGIETAADVTDAANVAAAGAPIISSGAGAPSSTPSAVGDIYVDTTGDTGWVAAGTASSADWKQATGAGGGDLLAANNLSDVALASTARTNLGLAIGTDVQAYDAVLDATTASFTTADETKLDGIEAAADVTDVTNVTAAGALMDSEVDADIKTLVLPASTTISAFGATVVDDADAAAVRTTIGAAADEPVPTLVTGTTDTLDANDHGLTVRYNNAAQVTVTIPTDAADDLPDGFWVALHAEGADGVTLDTTGITLTGAAPRTSIAQDETLVLRKTSTADTWLITDPAVATAVAYGATTTRSDNQVPIAACLAAHGSCYVGPGVWPCSDEVLLADDQILSGAGRLKTTLKHAATGHHGVATAVFDTQTNSDDYALADVVSGAEIRDLRIEGPDIVGAEPPVAGTDHGIALFGRRLTIENVDVRFWSGHGIICELGTEGGIEYDTDHQSNLYNVFVRRCGLTGITWRTPDAYLDNIFVSYVRGHGVHMDDTGNYNGSADGGFWHVYSTGYGASGAGSGGAGVRADGRLQIHQLQLDGCFGSSLESVSADCQYGQVYAFLGHRNDAGGAAASDVHIDLQSQCQIGVLKVKCQEGGTGVKLSNTRIQIGELEVDGSATDGIGLHLTTAASYCRVGHARIFSFDQTGGVGIQLDGSNSFTKIGAVVSDCKTGVTDAGGSNDTRYDINVDASATQTTHTYVYTGARRRDVIIPSGAGTVGVPVRGDYVDPTLVTGTTDQLAATDHGLTVRYNNASAVTVTVPTDATDDLPDGFWVALFSEGAGGVTLSTTGVTLVGSSPNTTIAQNEVMVLQKTSTANTWVVTGATAA